MLWDCILHRLFDLYWAKILDAWIPLSDEYIFHTNAGVGEQSARVLDLEKHRTV